MKICTSCGKSLKNVQILYCSNLCQKNHEYADYIKNWKSGSVNGTRGKSTFNMSNHVIRYIFDKYDSKCARCGWSEMNKQSMSIPLEIDHIDGNHENNAETNLILLCPNCHSLTPTYKNSNKGHGRGWRREKYVKIVEVPL